MKILLFLFLLSAPVFPALGADGATYARFVPEREDDFAWENDLVAFRAYGPAMRRRPEDSGIDCWLKRVTYPIIDKWYEGNTKGLSYHKDHGEGYDPYHVGSSRGCGGTALWVNGAMVISDTFTDWKILEQTPGRTVLSSPTNTRPSGPIPRLGRSSASRSFRASGFSARIRPSPAMGSPWLVCRWPSG